MKNISKKLFILGCLFFTILTYQVLDSYGIFESNTQSDVSSNLAKWQILLNGSNVTGEVNTFNINSLNWEANTGVLSGKAAPGLSAYFEIIINPTGSEVSIEYEITLDFLGLENDEIYLTSIKDHNGTPLTQIDTNKYSGIIYLADILLEEVETIRVDLIWDNDELNNEVDSEFVGQTNPMIDIPISVKLSQYTG